MSKPKHSRTGVSENLTTKITIPFTVLPEAKTWEDGETYEITVKQVSSDKDGATFDVLPEGSKEEEDSETPEEEDDEDNY